MSLAFTCECTEHKGAVLVLDTSGVRMRVHQTQQMKTYMLKNLVRWHGMATQRLGLAIAAENMLFVRGCVKTTKWAMAAFWKDSRGVEASFNGGVDNYASIATGFGVTKKTTGIYGHHIVGSDGHPWIFEDMSVEPKTTSQTHQQNRSSPPFEQTPRDNGHGAHADEPRGIADEQAYYPPDQCIFLSYFKLKKRMLLPDKSRAAAEPQDQHFPDSGTSGNVLQMAPSQGIVSASPSTVYTT